MCAVVSSGQLEKTVTVTFTTQDGTATSSDPQDFTSLSNNAVFDQATSRACADISIINDAIFEDSETFTVTVSGVEQGVDFVSPASATVTILDNDIVTIGFEMARYEGNEGEMTEVCVAVSDGVTVERAVTVRLTTQDATAKG